jgi:hypothetical protein
VQSECQSGLAGDSRPLESAHFKDASSFQSSLFGFKFGDFVKNASSFFILTFLTALGGTPGGFRVSIRTHQARFWRVWRCIRDHAKRSRFKLVN